MLKFLLTLVVVVVAAMMWFGKGRQRVGRTAARPAAPPVPQAMVPCERCGVHLPRPEAFIDDRGRLFCSAEHRRLGPPGGR